MDKHIEEIKNNTEKKESGFTENVDIITLNDEDGNQVKFEIIASLYLDEQEYAIVIERDDTEQAHHMEGCEDCQCSGSHNHDEDEVTEIMIFKVIEEGEEFVFENVQDEDELNEVLDAYQSLLDEEEDENVK